MRRSRVKGLRSVRYGRGLALDKLLSCTRGNSNSSDQYGDHNGTEEVHLEAFLLPITLASDEMPVSLPADGCTLVPRYLSQDTCLLQAPHHQL